MAGKRIAGPIIYSFHLPKMSDKLKWVALDLPLKLPVSEPTAGCLPLPHLIDLHWVFTAAHLRSSGCQWGSGCYRECVGPRWSTCCLLDHNTCDPVYAAVAVVFDCQTTENCFTWIKPKCFLKF